MSAPQQSHCKVVVGSILPKQTIVSIIGKQCEAGYSHIYNFYCSRRSCKLFKNNLYTDYYSCYILKWQGNSNFEKEMAQTSFASPQEICKFSFLLFEVQKNVQFYAFKRAYTIFSNSLQEQTPPFLEEMTRLLMEANLLMKPFVLCFCSGRCRVYFYRGHFGFADVYSRQYFKNIK